MESIFFLGRYKFVKNAPTLKKYLWNHLSNPTEIAFQYSLVAEEFKFEFGMFSFKHSHQSAIETNGSNEGKWNLHIFIAVLTIESTIQTSQN
jgi:hypothetical protein